jgi:hypothetical protein
VIACATEPPRARPSTSGRSAASAVSATAASSTSPVHSIVACPSSRATRRPYGSAALLWARYVTSPSGVRYMSPTTHFSPRQPSPKRGLGSAAPHGECEGGRAGAPGLEAARRGPSPRRPARADQPVRQRRRPRPAPSGWAPKIRPKTAFAAAGPRRSPFGAIWALEVGRPHPSPSRRLQGPDRRRGRGSRRSGGGPAAGVGAGPGARAGARPPARAPGRGRDGEGARAGRRSPRGRDPGAPLPLRYRPSSTISPRSALVRAASITSRPAIASSSGTGGGAPSRIALTMPS